MYDSPDQKTALPLGVELEHKSLRDEILTRIRLRQQIVGVTLTLSGAFLAFGLNRPAVALVYPPLALFLALGWAQNDHRIRNVATYIRKNIETHFDTPGWEISIKKKTTESGFHAWRFVIISHGGIFLGTQLLAIGVGVSEWTATPIEWVLLMIDSIATICVGLILRKSLR